MKNALALVLYFPMFYFMAMLLMQAVVKTDELRDPQREQRKAEHVRTYELHEDATPSDRVAVR